MSVIINFFKKQDKTKFKSHLHPARFDPAAINDEIAMKTQWVPVKDGESDTRTHRLKEISPRRMEVTARGRTVCLSMVFMAVAITIAIGGGLAALNRDFNLAFYSLIFGIILFLFSFLFYHNLTIPHIFDLNLGYYWKSRNRVAPIDMKKITDRCPLQEIHAIQLLVAGGKCHSKNENAFRRYEVNLVLKNGRRLNILNHNRHAHIRSEAQKLGQFLNLPVWDATFQGKKRIWTA